MNHDVDEIGVEHTDKLAAKYEATLRILIQAEAKLKANKRTIEEISGTLPADVRRCLLLPRPCAPVSTPACRHSDQRQGPADCEVHARMAALLEAALRQLAAAVTSNGRPHRLLFHNRLVVRAAPLASPQDFFTSHPKFAELRQKMQA